MSLRAVGRTDKCLAWLQRAVEADPGYPNAHGDMALVLNRDFGRHAEALPHADAAIAIDPDRPGYRANRVESLRGAGRIDEAW